ncbi:type IV pilus biogenesis/stability protein PilW [Rheinheimera sp. WS51]|uniref:type IV pilus biogenesis/stability protein PilW n=1 Tax=Rheinheimera sp. WS51 TaxID=3425886 RepID=UPI003D8A434D
MLKRKIIVGIAACSIMLTGCVSEQTYVGSDKPVANRSFDNIEAARTRISLGLNYLRRGDSSAAKYNLERARSFAPNSAEVYSALAYYYENVGEADQAEEHYLIAIDKDPNYADAYNNYGAFLCQLQKYEAAERLLLKAISRPGYIRVAESYENLAMCQLQQNNFRKTKTYLDNSINHNSTRISSLILSSGLSYAMGEIKQAKNQLAKIQRLGRVSSRTVLLSYLIADKSGDTATKNNAEQLLLTLYMGSAETTLLLQDKLELSEFELLRERYKETLMSNVVIPTANVKTEVIAKPVENPKLKIVKRKTDPETGSAVNTAASSDADSTKNRQTKTHSVAIKEPENVASSNTVSTVPVLQNETTNIANSLSGNSSAVVAKDTQAQAPEAITETSTVGSEEPVKTVSVEELTAAKEAASVALAATRIDELPEETILVERELKPVLTEAAASTSSDGTTTAIKQPELEQATVADDSSAEQEADLLAYQVTSEPKVVVETTEILPAEMAAESSAVIETAQPEYKFHLVQDNDSLYAISVKYNIRLQSLMDWNKLTPESTIKTGQKVWLQAVPEDKVDSRAFNKLTKVTAPGQVAITEPYHEVAAGETMFAISYRYNIKLDKFMAWNNLSETSSLYIGQKLLIKDPELIKP